MTRFVLSSVFGLLGVSLFGHGLIAVCQAWASRSWPVAPGAVIESRVEKAAVRRGFSYTPIVTYRYLVGLEAFTNGRIRVVDQIWTGNPDTASRLVARYPAGGNVVVAYDPRKYDSSVLEPGVWRGSYLNLVGGFGFALFGGLMVLPLRKWAVLHPRLLPALLIGLALAWMSTMGWLLS